MTVGMGNELLLKGRMSIGIWLLVSLKMSQLQHQFPGHIGIFFARYGQLTTSASPIYAPHFKNVAYHYCHLASDKTILRYSRGIPATLPRPFLLTWPRTLAHEL